MTKTPQSEFRWIKTLILNFIGLTYGVDALKREMARGHFFTGEEWRERGENYGYDGILVMIIEESPLFHDLNAYADGWVARHDAFYRMLEDAGYYAQLGNAWNLAVYKR